MLKLFSNYYLKSMNLYSFRKENKTCYKKSNVLLCLLQIIYRGNKLFSKFTRKISQLRSCSLIKSHP